ncbi:MAG TPA: hypothetical protein VNA30_04015 [Mycobacteriales bacterium]|nr:hypothetical protein [Mycobacteriales bacterium]
MIDTTEGIREAQRSMDRARGVQAMPGDEDDKPQPEHSHLPPIEDWAKTEMVSKEAPDAETRERE